MSQPASQQFFDEFASEYDAMIRRCVPRYDEMLAMLVDYLPQDRNYRRIVELGAGTGNLSQLVHSRYPDAELVLVDCSASALAIAKKRLPRNARVELKAMDFAEFDWIGGETDLVVSSIALHHLNDEQKQDLFARLFRGLSEQGVFAYVDQFRGETPALHQKHMQNWYFQAKSLGASDQEWKTWMEHQAAHDFHATLFEQLNWLHRAGFSNADWTMIQADKHR
jgi:tRNA (cmo5U34)-methyltransferase